MSALPGGQPLDRVLPDLDDLLADPQAYLSEAPLAIGPRQMYSLAGMFGLPGLGLLLWCLVQGQADGERIALGVGLLVGGCVWLGWTLALRGHELVLHAEGVEVTCFGSTVWAPWALFHVEGRPFLSESDSPHAGLILPIDPRMIGHVRLLRDGIVVAWGRKVAGPQWMFTAHDEVVLPARYEVSSQDIGELLLVLGNRLGKEPPREEPPPEFDDSPTGVLAEADPTGWITLPLTRLRLPPCCARCGGPRDDTLRMQVMARGDWVMGIFLGGARAIELPVPICESCKEYLAARQRQAGAWGMALGATLGTAVGASLGAWLGEMRDLPLYVGTLAGFFVGIFSGSILGLTWSRRYPVRVRRYSPSRGLVQVRFENAEIASQVLHQLRSPSDPSRTP